MISVITPPATGALCTLADARVECGTDDASDAAVLGRLIDRVSSLIASYTGRTWGVQTIRETFPDGPRPLVLFSRPVVAVTEVLVGTTPLTADEEYTVDLGAGMLYRTARCGWTLGPVRRYMSVTYSAGYRLPNDPPAAGVADLPAALSDAALGLVRAAWFRLATDPAVQSDQLNGDVTRFGPRLGIDPAVAAQLAPHIAYAHV